MHRFTRVVVVTIAILAAACGTSQQSPLITPNPDSLAKPAPDSFKVAFETSQGRFVVQAYRAWAPNGVDRFYYLARNNYYDHTKFFRNLPDFMAQFGLHGDPRVNVAWRDKLIPDDPVRQSNQRGYVSYAAAGPNTRSTQLFINKRDNRRLDPMGFAPIGRVIEGIEVVDKLYTGYGEDPDQDRIGNEGNSYLERVFPRLDSIISTRVVKD